MVESPRMFASMFTMSVFLIFGYCLTTICYLAYDPDARFFIGRWPLWGLLWVPLFGVAHWWHLKKERPVRSVMMACVFGPATTYFIIGWVVLHEATHLHTVLRSSDCSRTEEFKTFNEAALAARAFHNKCLADRKEALLIHYCPGYEDEKAQDNRAQTWEYLKYAEHNYGCAGFCNVKGDPSMWTYQGYQDSCAAATANVMNAKIGALAFQMMVYSIIVVVMFLLWIEIMSPTLKAIEKKVPLPERRKEVGWGPGPEERLPGPQSYPPAPQLSGGKSYPPVAPSSYQPPPQSASMSLPQASMPVPAYGSLSQTDLPAPSMPRVGAPSTSLPPPATTQAGSMGQGWTIVDQGSMQQSMQPSMPPLPLGSMQQSMPPSMPPAMPPSMPPAFTSSRLD